MKRAEPSRIFISHARANLATAHRIELALQNAGQDAWLDDSDVHIGVLLRPELQQAIASSRAVVLVWSKAASKSRWVASEILTAFHLNRFIVSCVLDAVTLPQFLSRSISVDLRRDKNRVLEKLAEQIKEVPAARNEFPEAAPYQSPELLHVVQHLAEKQREIVSATDLQVALRLQRVLDPEMRSAEKRWRYDSTILNLAGYHRKNAYMFKHWDEYCAGRFPHQLLNAAEGFFYKTLFVNPLEFSALNGLGNILMFRGELQAALFFVERAIGAAQKAGFEYQEAKHDRKLILQRMRRPPSSRAAHA